MILIQEDSGLTEAQVIALEKRHPVYMFVCALIIIGLVVTGVLEVRWAARSPVAQVIAK